MPQTPDSVLLALTWLAVFAATAWAAWRHADLVRDGEDRRGHRWVVNALVVWPWR